MSTQPTKRPKSILPKQPKPAKPPVIVDGEVVFSVAQAADVSVYSRSHLFAMIARREIEFLKIGGQYYFTPAVVETLIARRKADLPNDGPPKKKRLHVTDRKSRTIRLPVPAFRILDRIRLKGGQVYESDNDVLAHIILHADACEHFHPGSPDAVFEKKTPVKVNTSGL